MLKLADKYLQPAAISLIKVIQKNMPMMNEKNIIRKIKSVVKESKKNSKTKTHHTDIKSTMLRNKWA